MNPRIREQLANEWKQDMHALCGRNSIIANAWLRWANADPVTGQAAWFDLRVRLEKSAAPDQSQPVFGPIGSVVGQGPGERP